MVSGSPAMSSNDRYALWHGRPTPPERPLTLRAGPVELLLDGADLRHVHAVIDTLVPRLTRPSVLVGKSTVPVGTAAELAQRAAALAPPGVDVEIAWNPEFLREGHAVHDTLHPDRIVLGVQQDSTRAEAAVRELYGPLLDGGAVSVPLNATYAAMVTRLDRNVGRLLDAVESLGLSKDTLVVFGSEGRFDLWSSVRNIGLLIGVLSCLTYFFFSVEHKGLVGTASRVGIWFLMVTFGASFAFTVMGRIALLASRVSFLFNDWLWLIDPTGKRPPGW